MDLIINGEQVKVADTVSTITDLLGLFNMQEKVVIVEANGLIIDRTAHSVTRICDGDKIEIVHFVGGG
ncbi:MAG: sulfur carrier protein ThiS [Turicibacter sp.]|nr:sulfur carrier protein ThiS [Turicibacter sp.]